MNEILRVESVFKSFGRVKVLDGISLGVPEGSVFGFIGANGAGKTTTMKIILGLLARDEGEVYVCGEKVRFGMTPTNRNVGYLPDVPEFYNYMKPAEYLRLCGKISEMRDAEINERTNKLLDLVGLKKANKKIGAFSRGMKQRLGVAQALINSPKLLICDEPTSALDPVGRKDILNILQQIKGETTVIFSTHILSDVEKICDRAAVLRDGKIVLEGALSELTGKNKTNGVRIEFAKSIDAARFKLRLPDEILINHAEPSDTELILNVRDVAAAQRLAMATMLELDITPSRIELLEAKIEDLFMEAFV